MGARTVATKLATRTTFSSAINILPNELVGTHLKEENVTATAINETAIKPYSSIPGPKELPLIGNSWRFAPIIGKKNIALKYSLKKCPFDYFTEL